MFAHFEQLLQRLSAYAIQRGKTSTHIPLILRLGYNLCQLLADYVWRWGTEQRRVIRQQF